MTKTPQEHVSLKEYTTFKLGGKVSYFFEVHILDDLTFYVSFAKEKGLPLIILGGGSNIILPDTDLDACVGLMKMDGFEKVHTEEQSAHFKIGAGVVWDDAVLKSIEAGYCGIEAMSAIPGSTGATVIQNVGAYGQDISQVLYSVDVYDTEDGQIKTLSHSDCEFAYRDSVFKRPLGRYIILSLVLKLSLNIPSIPKYPGVKEYFEIRSIQNPTAQDIRSAITEIRWMKLPNPKEVYSVGSFFKNPIVEKTLADRVLEKYPHAVCHQIDEFTCKLGAGFLIDALGLKGKSFGNLCLYKNNALVVVNNGHATRAELMELVAHIQEQVKGEFGLLLEPEPVFI